MGRLGAGRHACHRPKLGPPRGPVAGPEKAPARLTVAKPSGDSASRRRVGRAGRGVVDSCAALGDKPCEEGNHTWTEPRAGSPAGAFRASLLFDYVVKYGSTTQ